MLVVMISETLPSGTEELDRENYMKSMYAMVVFGGGEICGGFFIGQIVDRINSKAAIWVNLASMVVMTGFTLGFLADFSYGWLVFAMTFTWGFQDGCVNTHSFEMIGFEFQDSAESFSVFYLVESIGVVIFSVIDAFVTNRKAYMIYSLGIGALGMGLCSLTLTFQFKKPLQS
mmetsp:Transcript_17947/g.17138  ORF Transcript_17947/g.17138 Transcript_17947/m.17138 type:complete len:173 (+) Transcript_17947:111-629(+)